MSKGHQDVQRRTWNKDEFEARAREREATERAGKKFKTQKEIEAEEARDAPRATVVLDDPTARPDMQQYDFKAMVGTRKIVTAENALSEQGGFYCEPCDYLLKDQKSYLEHCNKAQHLRRMGLPTEVKRSTADDVRARLEALKQKSAGANKSGSGTGSGNVASDAKKKEAGGDKTKKVEEVSKKRAQPEEADQEPDMAAFGLPMSFGSSKK